MNQKDLELDIKEAAYLADKYLDDKLEKYCIEPDSLAWKITITVNDGYTEERYTLNKDGMYMGDLTPIVVKGG